MKGAKIEAKEEQKNALNAYKGGHVNNAMLQTFAECAVKLKVIENMTDTEIEAGERLGSLMELLLLEFPTYAEGVKRQHLHIEDIIATLPPGLWDNLNKNKKHNFELYAAAVAQGINKSLIAIEKVLKDMATVLDGLSEQKEALKEQYQEEAIEKVYKIQKYA